jgi:GNAT superfamily N-acetyltransferase
MDTLEIEIIPADQVSSELDSQIDQLDRLAFGGDGDIDNDPEFSGIQWSSPDWMALGFQGEELVTQLCLPKRQITVGVEKIWVAGIGGMATHPNHHHKGYGSALLKAAETFMRDQLKVPFGLLICASETRRFYELAYWQLVADALYHEQGDQKRILHTSVMILQLENQTWPVGEIDLCGLPW